MDYENLIDRITDLSLRDTKSLSQKGLKAAEEVGELGKAILPFEGAHGTNHRCPSEDKVIEECADVMLVAYSIIASMGVSFEDAMKVVSRKADYWEFLLDNEDKADLNSLDFEIHITISEADDIDTFRADCHSIGVKPIVLDLYTEDQTILDVMTSSRFRGSTKDVMRHTKHLAAQLREMGYNVVREKIETVPWHPAAMVSPTKPSAYFEAHIAFEDGRSEALREFALANNIHLSKNAMKKGNDAVIMGTYRVDATEITSREFNSTVDNICKKAETVGLGIRSRPHTEYSLWDTNEMHDGEWINERTH